MRFLGAGALLAMAAFGAVLVWMSPLSYAWNPGERDSPWWVYVLFSSPPMFLTVGALVGAVYVLRKRPT